MIMNANWLTIIAFLMPVPAIYLIYYRFLVLAPEYRKHAEACAGGILFATILLIVRPYIIDIIQVTITTIPLKALLEAALPEKLGAAIVLLAVFKYYANFSIIEGMLSAAMFGFGFSLVENGAYSLTYGDSIMTIRTLFSLPLHVSSCGILGYFLARRTLCATPVYRSIYLVKGIVYSVVIHAAFDALILSRSSAEYAAALVLVGSISVLEVLLAKSHTIPGRDILKAMGLRHEDGMAIEAERRYERWILQSMGRSTPGSKRIFLWNPSLSRVLFVLFLMGAAIYGISFRNALSASIGVNLSESAQIMIFGIFPVSLAAILLIIGSVNPDFFRSSEMRIPVIAEASIIHKVSLEEETFITYVLGFASCFLKTSEPIGIGQSFDMELSYAKRFTPPVRATIVWENHQNRNYPFGSIVSIDSKILFKYFIVRYTLFKFRKGLVYHLRLPGFESVRKLFLHPVSAMQEERLFTAGSVVFHEGDPADKFFLVKTGRVNLFKTKAENAIAIGAIEEGQIFGEMAVIPGRKRGSSAICEVDSIIAIADRANLFDLIQGSPEFSLLVIQMLAERTEASENILLEYIALLEREEKRNTTH